MKASAAVVVITLFELAQKERESESEREKGRLEGVGFFLTKVPSSTQMAGRWAVHHPTYLAYPRNCKSRV